MGLVGRDSPMTIYFTPDESKRIVLCGHELAPHARANRRLPNTRGRQGAVLMIHPKWIVERRRAVDRNRAELEGTFLSEQGFTD